MWLTRPFRRGGPLIYAQVILPITKAPFRSRSLLVQSLTHSSFLPEKIKDEGTGRGTYSPLAFLGDAVIALHARELVLDEVSGETSNSQSLGAMNVRYHALVSIVGLAVVRFATSASPASSKPYTCME